MLIQNPLNSIPCFRKDADRHEYREALSYTQLWSDNVCNRASNWLVNVEIKQKNRHLSTKVLAGNLLKS